jgi:hypothetical protein
MATIPVERDFLARGVYVFRGGYDMTWDIGWGVAQYIVAFVLARGQSTVPAAREPDHSRGRDRSKMRRPRDTHRVRWRLRDYVPVHCASARLRGGIDSHATAIPRGRRPDASGHAMRRSPTSNASVRCPARGSLRFPPPRPRARHFAGRSSPPRCRHHSPAPVGRGRGKRRRGAPKRPGRTRAGRDRPDDCVQTNPSISTHRNTARSRRGPVRPRTRPPG